MAPNTISKTRKFVFHCETLMCFTLPGMKEKPPVGERSPIRMKILSTIVFFLIKKRVQAANTITNPIKCSINFQELKHSVNVC